MRVAEDVAEMLLVELGRGVDRPGEVGASSAIASGTTGLRTAGTWFEAKPREFGGGAGPGPDGAVPPAAVAPVAVDDHAAREHEATAEVPVVQRAQQGCRPEVVRIDVVTDVGEVDAEPDHRGLVTDRLHVGHRVAYARPVAQVDPR